MVKSDQVNTDREDVPIIPRDQREVEKGTEDGGQAKGLGVCMTSVFMIGQVAGVGMLAIPKAVDNAGYVGIVFLLLACVISVYTALILGRSWVLVQERYAEFRGPVRFPYPAIGQVTYGRPGRVMVSLCINSSMYCTGIVMMLLCAENIQNMVGNSGVDLSVACWTLIVAAIITPVMWLGTPKDFWFVAVAAVVVTTVACGVLLGNIAYDGVRLSNVPVQHTVPSVMSTCMAFGPMVFAIGGHPVFPTFQNDMKEPEKFNISVYFSYIIIVSMYLSVSVAAYAVYGSTLEDNILLTVSHGPMLYIVQILITAHLLFGFVIILNPVCQDVEELLGVPKDFTWKRCLLRSAAMIFAVIIAVSVPSFGLVLSLVGGSTMALLTVICPLVFYHKLSSMEGEWAKTHINMLTRILDYIIIVAGFLLGILCTFSSVVSLIVHDPDVPSAVSNSTNITEQS